MNIETNKTETITWDIEGCDAKAIVSEVSGKGVSIERITIVSKAAPDQHKFITYVDESFARDVHKALTELINHLDRKRGVGRIHIDTSNMIESLDLTTAKPYFDKLPSIEELDKKLSKQMKSGHDSIQ